MRFCGKPTVLAICGCFFALCFCGCSDKGNKVEIMPEPTPTSPPVVAQETPIPTSTPEIITPPKNEDPLKNYKYRIENNEAIITKYTGAETEIIIPSEINGSKVTVIGYGAFENCTSLTDIAIPNSVTSIGNEAFKGTPWYNNFEEDFVIVNNILVGYKGSDKSITIPDSVTTINCGAFSGCTSLTDITISDSVMSVGQYAFKGCVGLTSITIPDSVTSIDYYAFEDCTGLTSVAIPSSVDYIAPGAFSGCTNLKSIKLSNSITSIYGFTFDGCTSLTSITIPSSLTDMHYDAFLNTNLKSVYFEGNAPLTEAFVAQIYSIDFFDYPADDFKIYYKANTTGWTNPWMGYPTEEY